MAKSFTFKQFHIDALGCGMPVSTDSILLGAWADVVSAKSILDIGCGTGLLALMCAQRNPVADITALEIEENAYQAAIINSINSPWANRLSIEHLSIQEFSTKEIKFDAIICNPPYFNNGLTSSNYQRSVARHTSALTHQNLLNYCYKLLEDQGIASFVLPKEEGLNFIELLENIKSDASSKLVLTRLTYIKTTVNKPATRVLIELQKQKILSLPVITGEVINAELIINNGQEYSCEFINLTKPFYLKM